LTDGARAARAANNAAVQTAEQRGFKIPPYKLAYIAELSSKITRLISDSARFSLTLSEANIVIDVVRNVLNVGGGEDD